MYNRFFFVIVVKVSSDKLESKISHVIINPLQCRLVYHNNLNASSKENGSDSIENI